MQFKDSYNYSIEQLEGDSGIAPAYGIKKSSRFNDSNYFHVIEDLPPDIAHDMFEGLAVDVISDILDVLVEEKYPALQETNIRIATFKYSNHDEASKPQPIKFIPGSNFKLKETGCEMWNSIRHLPLMLDELNKKNNCVWMSY